MHHAGNGITLKAHALSVLNIKANGAQFGGDAVCF
jgi:hypothetical protein